MTGIYHKYIVRKADNSPVDPDADYFVLRLDTDARARHAARTYARNVESVNPQLAADLYARCERHALDVIEREQEEHHCPSCGLMTRNTTAGCDHCELEDK